MYSKFTEKKVLRWKITLSVKHVTKRLCTPLCTFQITLVVTELEKCIIFCYTYAVFPAQKNNKTLNTIQYIISQMIIANI